VGASSGTISNPKVVTGGINNPEVGQAPGTIPEVITQRPSGRYYAVPLTIDIVNLKHELSPGGRQPSCTHVRNCSSGSSNPHAAPFQRHIRRWLGALVLGDGETQDDRVEVHSRVKIFRKEFHPQCHLHHRMVAHQRVLICRRLGLRPGVIALAISSAVFGGDGLYGGQRVVVLTLPSAGIRVDGGARRRGSAADHGVSSHDGPARALGVRHGGVVMGAGAAQPLVVPAWCDPQVRTYRLSWADTLVGLLVADDERFVFATPAGVVFNALRSQSMLAWRRGKAFGMIPRFDLSTVQGSFRLYLSRPSATAPLYRPATVAEVGEKLAEAGDTLGGLLDLVTKFGGIVQLAGAVGQFMEGRADYREMRQGHAAARALRAKISAQSQHRPPSP
jgi:hypothetical protein